MYGAGNCWLRFSGVYSKVNLEQTPLNDLLTKSSKTNYERTTGKLTIWLTIDDCLTVPTDGSKHTNYITTNQVNDQSIIPSTDVIQLTFTSKMTTAQVVEMSVTGNNISPNLCSLDNPKVHSFFLILFTKSYILFLLHYIQCHFMAFKENFMIIW